MLEIEIPWLTPRLQQLAKRNHCLLIELLVRCVVTVGQPFLCRPTLKLIESET
jgi:hypothetical protein